jgi:AcrR family transcriptional regulator
MRAQGGLSIQRMCELAGVSRASFYRHWEEREPVAAQTELCGAVQRLALAHRYYGYRRIAMLLQRGIPSTPGTKTCRWGPALAGCSQQSPPPFLPPDSLCNLGLPFVQ